ncbi:histidinol dehydrogenase [Lacihabitans sp. CCS-44]|uniref:histidinol dehydrogenase n=1 Tax=Lacihabitans sp. CCS-44 TaxID=2487331 RepID=UPI0020CDF220|nr:histidinol dehydrogenase [Lacihabitans sp. CCS-44]MCP9755008.1 histidinol dehydrogenase [Lacihabitans sp. CCS-44]
MNIFEFPSKERYADILKRPTLEFDEIEQKVRPIILEVKNKGDEALRKYALEFDNILIDNFKVDLSEIQNAGELLDSDLKKAIDQAFENIYTFHKAQQVTERVIETMPGVKCWRKSVGIEKVGIYIPGGSAPLFSTVLMLGIPALIAGCKQVVLCSPSNHPAIYYAASKCGIKDVFRIGGSQAIAAMAFGTDTVPRVYKIFGPGNQYVTSAKQLVNQFGTAIDMPAGPSEVAVLADLRANPTFIASDLLSQAEHGPDSQVILVSDDLGIIKSTLFEVEKQLENLPRKEIAKLALENSKAILVENMDVAIDILNEYAAEHLILQVTNPEEIADKIINAGSIFLGDYTPESCGDYASGTNHTLPTNGYAKAYSGVSLDSFVKKITLQQISKEGIKNLGPYVEIMAEAEQLFAHKNAVTVRLES